MNGPFPGEGRSAFAGHLLTEATELPSEVIDSLAALDITDAEQLVALSALEIPRKQLDDTLGLSGTGFNEIVAVARASIQEAHAAALEVPGDYDLATGARKPPEGIRAVADELPTYEPTEAPTALPAAVTWVKNFGPTRSQAARGTCVAFAVTAMHEFCCTVEERPQNLSEQHLYYETKLIDGDPNGCGTFQASAVQALANRGQCRETMWPYNPNAPCNNHGALPSDARADAGNFRRQAVSIAPNDVNAIKTALAAGSVVPISIPVYDSWYRSAATRDTGRITMRLGNEPSDSGHAVCLVGYQNEATAPGGGYFILRNSWANWGARNPYGAGYGTIPYQYIADDNWESFTAIPRPADQQPVEVEHQMHAEFLGRGEECWVRVALFRASSPQAATAVHITRLRLRSWDGDRVIDEFVLQPRDGTGDIALQNLWLRGKGDRSAWSYRVSWDWTRRARLTLARDDVREGAEALGGEVAESGGVAPDGMSGRTSRLIEAADVTVVINVRGTDPEVTR